AQTAQSAVSQVANVANLLAARRVRTSSFIPPSADWQSAIQQAGSLRYESVHGESPFVISAGIGTMNHARVRSAGFPACGCTGHSCPVFLFRATGKSPEPADRNVCTTYQRFMESLF